MFPLHPAGGLLDALTLPAAVMGPDGSILRVNEAWAEENVRRPEPLRSQLNPGGRPALLLEHREDLGLVPEHLIAGLGEVLRGERTSFETSFQEPGQRRPKWLRVRGAALPGEGVLITHEDVTADRQVAQAQAWLASSPWLTGGGDFWRSLAAFLAEHLGMDDLCLDRLSQDHQEAITLAVWHRGHFEDNHRYTLRDTPCGEVVGQRVCCIQAGVQERFPMDAVLRELGAESYLGVTLLGTSGEPIGLIAAMDPEPLTPAEAAWGERVLALVAVRAGGELEREAAASRQHLGEARLDLSFQAAPIGMTLADLQGRFLRVNPTFCAMVDRAEAELLELDFRAITHPEDRAEDEAQVARLLAGEAPSFHLDKRYVRRDGSSVWVQLSVSLVRDSQGVPLHFLAQMMDITARRRSEQQQRLTVAVLDILNAEPDTPTAASRICQVIQGELGLEAVALRFAQDGDFGYLAHIGFPEAFIQAENCLRARSTEGLPLLDEAGQPLFECVCGCVLTGATDPANPLFTPGGSAWTNDARPVVDHRPGGPIHLLTRNRCIESGYRSVAIIPLRAEGRILGALQLNDRRPASFTHELIEDLERLGTSIGLAFGRRASKQELAAREAQYRLLAENAADVIWTMDLQGRFTYISPSVERLRGYTPKEIMAAPLEAALTPDSMAVVGQAMAEGLAHLQATGRFPLWQGELEQPCKDGSTVWTDVTVTGLEDDHKQVIGILGVTRDIQARRVVEAESRRQAEELDAFFRTNPDLLAIATLDGRFHCVNQEWERTLGWSAAELTARPFLELVHPEDLEDTLQAMAKLEGAREVLDFVNRYRHRDGSYRWLEWRSVPLEGRVIAAARDITERREAEERERVLAIQLHQSQKMESLGSLAGGVAHDLNNVLGAILSLSTALRTRTEPPDPLAGHLDTIIKACTRGRDVVNSLLVFSRKTLETSEPVDLNALVEDLLLLLSHTTLQRIRLVRELQPGLPRIRGEAGSLSHALMNLCVNAVDAMPEGGTLTLTTVRRHDGRVELRLKDTGHGMTPEILERAREPFFTTKPYGKGTGLGLSLVHGTLQAHGGTLELHSHPGQGTEVVLLFPQERVEADPTPPEVPEPENPLPQGALRVLLVDDDELILDGVGMMLDLLGHRVHAAKGGAAALQLVELGLRPDLVLLDMNMPGMSGEETLPELWKALPGLRVVLATGYRDHRVERLLAEHPQLRCISKPYTLQEVRELIATVATS